MTKTTMTEIALNNSKYIKDAENKYSNIWFIRDTCFRYLYRRNKFMIENQKQADVLIFTCISNLELKGYLIEK